MTTSLNQSADGNNNVFQFQINTAFLDFGKRISDEDEKNHVQKALDAYLRSVIIDKNKIPLEIILAETEIGKKLDLSDITLPEIFTELDVTYRDPEEQLVSGDLGRKHAVQAIAENGIIVILGNPGAGKTTLVNYISVLMARALKNDKDMLKRIISESKGKWDIPLFPVNINIRSFANSKEFKDGVGNATSLINYISNKIIGYYDFVGVEVIKKRIVEMMEDGLMLLILDGLDLLPGEIPGKQPRDRRRAIEREKLKSILVNFVNIEETKPKNKRNRIIVTSRSYAYHEKDTWNLGDKFSVADLMPFTEKQIEDYIGYWLDQLEKLKSKKDDYRPISNAVLSKYKSDYLEMILQKKYMLSLARTPLILTFIVSRFGMVLNGNRKTQISRIKLYNDIIEMLVRRWAVYVEVDSPDESNPKTLYELLNIDDYEVFLSLLSVVAFEAHKNMDNLSDINSAYVTKDTLRKAYKIIQLRQNIDGEPDEKVWEQIERRFGILMPSSEPREDGTEVQILQFPHLSLQEALAAKAIMSLTKEYLDLSYWPAKYIDDPDSLRLPDLLAGLIDKQYERWQEVISLVLETLKPKPSELSKVINKLLEDTSENPLPINDALNPRWYGALLLGRYCSDGYVNARGNNDYKDLGKWLYYSIKYQAMNQDERIRAGEYLGKVGDWRTGDGINNKEIWLPVDKVDDNFWTKVGVNNLYLGTPKFAKNRLNNEHRPQDYQKQLKNSFYVSRYQITNSLFEVFVKDEEGYNLPENWDWSVSAKKAYAKRNISVDFSKPNYPCVNVNWFEAIAFCKWLSKKNNNTMVVSLPTEWQWIAAAQAGDDTIYVGTNDDRIARKNRFYKKTCSIGLFPPNKLGIYDLGNIVSEWTRSAWTDSFTKGDKDRSLLSNASKKCVKGSSSDDYDPRIGRRFGMSPFEKSPFIGFRIVVVTFSERRSKNGRK